MGRIKAQGHVRRRNHGKTKQVDRFVKILHMNHGMMNHEPVFPAVRQIPGNIGNIKHGAFCKGAYGNVSHGIHFLNGEIIRVCVFI